MKKIAIFDIDGTIFRSSLLIEITEALIEAGLFKSSAKKYYSKQHKNWLNRKDSYEKYIDRVVRAFELNIKGVKYNDFIKISKKVIAAKRSQTYQYTRDLIQELKKKDYFLLAISNSPKIIVDEFCKRMGFNKAYGRMYEVNEKGIFTGAIMHREMISNKAKVLQRVIEKEKLTIKNSIAVGDTESDIPMFKVVSKPICFNPNKKLYRVAKKNQWKVIIERKDVFYEVI
ncbi:MAG TPA: HAD family phosphatase [Candidatus Moranbacteria bacterium]|nr:HAD family phosphatase [Candidatus Moranbacteria bacterium]HRZ33717.1 HAD family phosphatase [Candidatus Moranbacteria bacterium]